MKDNKNYVLRINPNPRIIKCKNPEEVIENETQEHTNGTNDGESKTDSSSS